MSAKIPGGNKKGQLLTEAETKDIEYWANRIARGLEDDPGKQYADRDREWLTEARAELARRNGGGQPAPAQARQQQAQPATQALARTSQTGVSVAGSHARADDVVTALTEASAQFHLVSPATACGGLPEGTEVVISMVTVDCRLDQRGKPVSSDIYPVGSGKFGLGKAPLDRIAGAAGVDWDPVLTRRLDDGRDPHYCSFQAVGYVRSFDGSRRTITGTKEMDLRAGSPQCEALAARRTDGSGDADKQIREMRLHILGHAESKAKLRAIRSLGLQTSYPIEDLRRPFAVARLMFTGRSQDPELRREFARMNAEAMIGGTRALYGAPALPPAAPAPRGYSTDVADDEYYYEPPRQITTTAEPRPPSEPRQPAPQPEPAAAEYDRGDDPNQY